MPAWTIALKDLRLLIRDTRAAIILLIMPLLFILVLGAVLGEAFGQKPDHRLRVSVVVEDQGPAPGEEAPPAAPGEKLDKWSDVVLRDLQQTAGIRVEMVPDRHTAEQLVRQSQRSAILVFGRKFSERVGRCSFLDDKMLKRPGLNPFFRDGVDLSSLDVIVLRDPTQSAASAIIEQVAQVTLLRVVLPWMIGKGFEEVSRRLPTASVLLPQLFSKYDLTAKTWAKLTRSASEPGLPPSQASTYESPRAGIINRGAARYQVLVPSYVVTFAFFLVLTCGWLFVTERRQGTLTRLRVAPVRREQILLGKFIPCLMVSLVQGLFLFVAGRLVFGMNWGARPWLLIPVIVCTSFAATGLALWVAGSARTESQVSVYGTLLVLLLAGVSGSLLPRDLMPESMRVWSKITPHAWALDAYNQLLLNPNPELGIVQTSCFVLMAFAAVFLAMSWWRVRLD